MGMRRALLVAAGVAGWSGACAVPGSGGPQNGTPAPAQIAGVLEDAAGRKLGGYVAIAQNTGSRELHVARVGADGSFALDVPVASTYTLNFLDAGAHYRGTLVLGQAGNFGAAYRLAHTPSQAVVTGFAPGKLGTVRLGENFQASASGAITPDRASASASTAPATCRTSRASQTPLTAMATAWRTSWMRTTTTTGGATR